MSELNNGRRDLAWAYFTDLVVKAITARSAGTVQDAIELANSLDLSFDELYANVPRSQWARHIAKDADDYAREMRNSRQ